MMMFNRFTSLAPTARLTLKKSPTRTLLSLHTLRPRTPAVRSHTLPESLVVSLAPSPQRRSITYSESVGSVPHDSVSHFEVRDANGRQMRLERLLDHLTLIVNIDCKVGEGANAECKELQRVFERHHGQGLQIIAFPSAQFQLISNQGHTVSAAQVKEDLEKRYHVTFPVMDKVNVNGDAAHPLFMFLQQKLSGFPVNVIKWDFTKFLCVDGAPRKRYSPATSSSTIEHDICAVLGCTPLSHSTGPNKPQHTSSSSSTNNTTSSFSSGSSQGMHGLDSNAHMMGSRAAGLDMAADKGPAKEAWKGPEKPKTVREEEIKREPEDKTHEKMELNKKKM